MNVSRTINPLHFEDLEPHRFEDLVRQLAYSFRDWELLEAVGRVGSDQGVDIRGIERGVTPPESDDDEEVQAVESLPPRVWIIQCKREKTIPPGKARKYVAESLAGKDAVHGYILAAAADFSAKARAACHEEAIKYGAQNVRVWGKAELEDMLFRPEHDHLLFAYFGISLVVRRRAVRSQIAARISLKRKLAKLIPLKERTYRTVLLRDPRATEYPFITEIDKFRERPLWRYYEPYGHYPHDHLRFIARETDAWYDPATGEWDIPAMRPLLPANNELFNMPEEYWNREHNEMKQLVANVPEDRKARIQILRYLSYDRIIAIDEIGDAFNPGPHLLVEYEGDIGFFEPEWVTPVVVVSAYDHRLLDIDKRVEFFG